MCNFLDAMCWCLCCCWCCDHDTEEDPPAPAPAPTIHLDDDRVKELTDEAQQLESELVQIRDRHKTLLEAEDRFRQFFDAIYWPDLADMTKEARGVADRVNTFNVINAAYAQMWDTNDRGTAWSELAGDRKAQELFERMFKLRKEYSMVSTYNTIEGGMEILDLQKKISTKEERVKTIRGMLLRAGKGR